MNLHTCVLWLVSSVVLELVNHRFSAQKKHDGCEVCVRPQALSMIWLWPSFHSVCIYKTPSDIYFMCVCAFIYMCVCAQALVCIMWCVCMRLSEETHLFCDRVFHLDRNSSQISGWAVSPGILLLWGYKSLLCQVFSGSNSGPRVYTLNTSLTGPSPQQVVQFKYEQ